MYFNVRDGVEVSGKVVLVHHGGTGGRSEETYAQVGDGEKVSQVLGGVQLPVQRGHIVQLGPGEQREPVFDFEAHGLVVLPHVASGIFLGADNVQQRVLGNVSDRLGLHSESVQAVGRIELVGLPGTSIVQRLLQNHLLRPTRLERDDNVIGQLDGLVPRERYVDRQSFGVFPPGGGLPEGGGVATLKVEHELWGMSQLFGGRVTFVVAHVGVFLKDNKF